MKYFSIQPYRILFQCCFFEHLSIVCLFFRCSQYLMTLTSKLRKKKGFYSSWLPLKCALVGKCSSDQRIGAENAGRWPIAISVDFLRLAEKSALQYSTTVPLFPNWHMAWPNFLPRDKRKEGTTCAQEKKWRSYEVQFSWQVSGIAGTHTQLVSACSHLIRTTLLFLQPASLHFAANAAAFWVSLRCVCKVWTARKTKSGDFAGSDPMLCIS